MRAQDGPPTDRFCPPAPFPGPDTKTGLALALRTFRSQIEGLPREVFEEDAWKPPLPGMPLFVMAPDAIQTVLLTEAEHYPHGALFERIMRPVWGKGLLLSRGEAWQTQRRASAQAFRAGDVAKLAPYFVQSARAALARWSALPDGRIDMFEEVKRITFDVILDTMLSGAEAVDREAIRQSARDFFADINRMRLSYFFRPDVYHERRPSTSSRHRAPLVAYIARLLADRRQSAPRGDLVDFLMAARDTETGLGLSDEQLADNLLGFILAGYETTATALTWTLYLAAAHPVTRDRLAAEATVVLGAGDVTPETLPQLVFARQVISEAMRLYPPAFLLTRVSMRDTTLAGHKVKAGQRINIPVYAIHRRPSLWADPHAFDPDRFDPACEAPSRYAYMPFGGGPRICIGAAFAMAEAVTILATLIRSAQFEPPSREIVWPQTGMALYPKNGMPMVVSNLAA